MSERFDNGNETRSLPEHEVKKYQSAVRKIRELLEWDLASMCGTTEEIEMVTDAQQAIKDVAALFHIPETKFWTSMPGASMAESMHAADEFNTQELPLETIELSRGELAKLQEAISKISDVLDWDISTHDEEDRKILNEAREGLAQLRTLA